MTVFWFCELCMSQSFGRI